MNKNWSLHKHGPPEAEPKKLCFKSFNQIID